MMIVFLIQDGAPPVILVGGLEHVCFSIYPLVNCYITMERSTMLFMGKLTISTGPFSIANCNKLPEGKHDVPVRKSGWF